jgi:hypothetical protein
MPNRDGTKVRKGSIVTNYGVPGSEPHSISTLSRPPESPNEIRVKVKGNNILGKWSSHLN